MEGDGGEAQEGGNVHGYTRLIHLAVWQKPTQHLKAIIPQLNIYMHTPSE